MVQDNGSTQLELLVALLIGLCGAVATGGGSIDGSGSANHLTYWVDADTVGYLASTDDGTDMLLTSSNSVTLDSGSLILGTDGTTAITHYGGTPIAQQTLSGTYDSTTLASVVNAIQDLIAAIDATGLILDGITWM